MGEEISNNRFTPKKSCIPLGRISTKVVERIVTFQILEFCHFFPFSLTWDHMGVKVSNDISSEKTTDLLPKIHGYSCGGSLPKLVVKRIVKFEILNFWHIFCAFFSMVVNREL